IVTRSPNSASVNSGASGEGSARTGACASITSRSSPWTKRAAVTLPSRRLAARSGRAGVMRGSKLTGAPDRRKLSVALLKERIKRARGLTFPAIRTAGLRARRPGEDVEVRPGFRRSDEAVQEQG